MEPGQVSVLFVFGVVIEENGMHRLTMIEIICLHYSLISKIVFNGSGGVVKGFCLLW